MQPNGNQNYWQPQDTHPETTPSSTPPVPPAAAAPQAPTQPPAPAAVPAPENAQQNMTIKPHDETFVAPQPDVQSEHEDEADDQEQLTWEASEFISHEKDILWFLAFIIVVLSFLAVSILLQAWTFVVLIIIMALATLVYVGRPPRTMRYSLSEKGLYIGEQFHAFDEFRAFDVIGDGAFYAIMLVSTKRFMPATLIYFAKQDGDRIVRIMSQHLPMEDLHFDLAEIIIRKLRL